jgi:hypothetical protein
MPALSRQQAADELGISPATLLRLTRDGTGKIQNGGRGGRGRKTLFDVNVIRAARGLRASPTQRSKASPEMIEQLDRGARALGLAQILIEDFAMLHLSGAFAKFRVPPDRRADLVRFLAMRAVHCVHEHLRIDERPDFVKLMEITASR